MRAGQFSVNFDPVLLDEFRSTCREKGEKYTKVLEELAKKYLESDGAILSVPKTQKVDATQNNDEVIQDLKNRLARLEMSDADTSDSFSTIYSRVIAIEKQLGIGKQKG